MTDLYKNECQIFTPDQVESLRRGGAILHDCLRHVAALVQPGVKTISLDRVADEYIRDHAAVPAFKGYQQYPFTLCTSVNDVCVHGMPGEQELSEGDIIALDCGVLLDSLYTDSCITMPVGQISQDAQQLIKATEEALEAGLGAVRAGAHTGDISSIIHRKLKEHGFDAMRQLTGHGLGATLHQFPEIPNFGEAGAGPRLPAHTIVAIEPISTMGSHQIIEDKDGWTLRTKDGALSAHFEHTVLVIEGGCEVLT